MIHDDLFIYFFGRRSCNAVFQLNLVTETVTKALSMNTHYKWWSLETWSRSRDASRDPFFEVSISKVSGLGLEGFRSRSRAFRLETLHRLFFMKFCKEFL